MEAQMSQPTSESDIGIDKDQVCIFIPTLNEERDIGEVINGFKNLGFSNIFVIDGHSTDRTVETVKELGVRVETQSGTGKGLAIQQAFRIIESDFVVMIDGDGTYLPDDINKLLKPVINGEADHVVGNRFADHRRGAFTRLNLFGNKALNKLFGVGYGIWSDDILSGYRAFTRRAVKTMHLSRTGFDIEVEMMIESLRNELRIVDVPITYLPRSSGIKTKLTPLRDGSRIAITSYKLLKNYSPTIYFGIIGSIFAVIGLISGIFVILDWLAGITRIPLTVFTALMIITGIQMFVFGMMGEIITASHRELMRELKNLKE